MDVIARCAFGMTIDSLGQKDDPFMLKAKEVFSPPTNKSAIILLPCKQFTRLAKLKVTFNIQHNSFFSFPVMFPKLSGKLGERVFFSESLKFFIDVLEDLVKQRSTSPEVIVK